MIDDTGNSHDLTLILVSLNLGVLLHEDGVTPKYVEAI